MTREKRLEKRGYKVSYILGTCDQNRGRMEVAIRYNGRVKSVYSSVTKAHLDIIGY